jgi:hypothetical protein
MLKELRFHGNFSVYAGHPLYVAFLSRCVENAAQRLGKLEEDDRFGGTEQQATPPRDRPG